MAIQRHCFGGGLESSDGRALPRRRPSAQVGQPEVKLGLIPGAGGTQRLPRLAGVRESRRAVRQRDPIGAKEAHTLGIVDRIIDGDLLAGAIAFAREQLPKRRPKRASVMTSSRAITPPRSDALGARCARQNHGHERPAGAPSTRPVRPHHADPSEDDARPKPRSFVECLYSTSRKRMIHVFIGDRTVGQNPPTSGKDTRSSPSAGRPDRRRPGTMGGRHRR